LKTRSEEVRDPSTNELLDRVRRRVGKLRVIETRERIAKCEHVGDLEVEYKVGDEVESNAKPRIAVFPIGDSSGAPINAGNALTEDLTTGLVEAGIPLVERTRLLDTLTELAIQQSDLFEVESAKKIGRQIGATAVLVGVIGEDGRNYKVNLRLTKVSTGEILLSHNFTLPQNKFPIAEGSNASSPSSERRTASSRTNLLAKSGLQIGIKKGHWKLQNSQLLFKGNSGDGLVTIPCDLPKQYRMTIKATSSGVNSVTHMAMYFRASGTEFIVTLDQDGSCVIVDGKDPRSDGSAKYEPVFADGKPNSVIYDVRNGSLIVTVNGRQFLRHRDARLGKTTSQDFSLGVVGEWTIEAISLTEP